MRWRESSSSTRRRRRKPEHPCFQQAQAVGYAAEFSPWRFISPQAQAAFLTRWRGEVREKPVSTRRAPLGNLGHGMPCPYILDPYVEHDEQA